MWYFNSYLISVFRSLLDFIKDPPGDDEMWRGYVLGVSFFVVNTFMSIGSNQIIMRNRRLGMHMKSSLIAAVYKKVG